MTDISNWPSLIRKEPITEPGWHEQQWLKYHPEQKEFGDYIMLPVSEYMIANLLGLLEANKEENFTGFDWYGEWLAVLRVAAIKLGLENLDSEYFRKRFRVVDSPSGKFLEEY